MGLPLLTAGRCQETSGPLLPLGGAFRDSFQDGAAQLLSRGIKRLGAGRHGAELPQQSAARPAAPSVDALCLAAPWSFSWPVATPASLGARCHPPQGLRRCRCPSRWWRTGGAVPMLGAGCCRRPSGAARLRGAPGVRAEQPGRKISVVP